MNQEREEQIAQLVRAGNAAKEMFNMILLDTEGRDEKSKKHYLSKLQKLVTDKVMEGTKEGPMTDKEAKVFGERVMEFGKYSKAQNNEKRIDDIPLDYLEWVHDIFYDFIQQLGRYLSSQRVKGERR